MIFPKKVIIIFFFYSILNEIFIKMIFTDIIIDIHHFDKILIIYYKILHKS